MPKSWPTPAWMRRSSTSLSSPTSMTSRPILATWTASAPFSRRPSRSDPSGVPAQQKIEVGALVGLQHVVNIHAHVAARLAHTFGRLPRLAAAGQFVLSNLQMKGALGNVQRDPIASLDQP